MKKHLIIGTAGHIDHGKTALVKALTNIDCDTHKEEKERGITINLGFSHFDLQSGESIGIIDVPGHKDFIKTMVAGAFGIDIALFVVAADSGIMPQTTEHFKIIETLGIKNGIVALTKTDIVDAEMLELAELEIVEFLDGSFLENAPIVKVSSVNNTGIEALISEISKLTKTIQSTKKPDIFRMYIDRLFNVKGIGFVATGSVLAGTLESGKNLYLLPGKNKQLKVRSIERHGIRVNEVYSGDRAALNLAGLKSDDFCRGMVLSDKMLEENRLIDATFKLFAENNDIGIWSKVVFYSGTFECAAKMHLMDKDRIGYDETAIVQIHLEKPAVLLNKDKYIIRNSSNDLTLGGGDIIDINPLHHRKRTPKLIKSLKNLAEAVLSSNKLFDLISIEVRKETGPVLVEKIARSLKLKPADVWNECQINKNETILTYSLSGKNILISKEYQVRDYKAILKILEEYHKKYPILEKGMKTKEFYGKFGYSSNDTGKLYIDALMEIIYKDGSIVNKMNTWAKKDHIIKIDPKTQKQIDWLTEELLQYKTVVPNLGEIELLSISNKINKEKLQMLLEYLVSTKEAFYVDGDYIHAEIVADIKKRLLKELVKKEKGINEKEFRLLINGSKRFVQHILKILIDEGTVVKQTFYIHITDKGKQIINKE